MIWPSLCVDNFLNEPEKIVEFSKTLKYNNDTRGWWPGLRSQPLHLADYEIYNKLCTKILSLYYPENYFSLAYRCDATFQKVPSTIKYDGWVHTDCMAEFTAIVYLSNHKNCGTSIYKSKKLGANIINEKIKHSYFKGEKIDDKILKKSKQENNSQFYKTIQYESIFNRLITFDGSNFHAAESFYKDTFDKLERLTLILFFYQITKTDGTTKYPITEAKRILI